MPGLLLVASFWLHVQLPVSSCEFPKPQIPLLDGETLHLLTCLSLDSGSIAHTHLQFQLSSDPSAAKPNKKMIAGETLTLKDTQRMLTHLEKQRTL